MNERPSTLRVLVVDDRRDLEDSYRMAFQQLGMEIDFFFSQDEALLSFQKHPQLYALVVTDGRLETCTGVDVFHGIRTYSSSVPVILISGQLDFFSKNALDLFDATLEKPFTLNALKQLVQRFRFKENP